MTNASLPVTGCSSAFAVWSSGNAFAISTIGWRMLQ
jgi:hypothetical protein